jgi:hypothetical protein
MRLFLPLLACFVTQSDRDAASDRDNDGYVAEELGGDDCDDSLSSVHPGAPESCLDAIDSDCDGLYCPIREERESTLWSSEILYSNGALADFDGDGSPELVLSRPEYDEDRGGVLRMELPLASDALPDAQSVGSIRGEDARQLWAWPLGDVDGDGDRDLAISTRWGPGFTAIVDHIEPGMNGTERYSDRWLVNSSDSDGGPSGLSTAIYLYGQVHTLGDTDGDGADEYLLAVPNRDGNSENTGLVYLLSGMPEGELVAKDHALQTWRGETESAYLGGFVGSSMDLDGDGQLEALIGVPGWTGSDNDGGKNQTGALFGLGSSSSGTEDPTAAVYGRTANAKVSNANAIGDLNGDGHEDLGVNLSSGSGQALIFLGPLAGDYFPEDADVRLLGDAGSDVTADFGGDLMGRLDLNEDGLGDLLVGASTEGLGEDTIPRAAGATYLYYGPLTGVQAPSHAAARWRGSIEDGNQRADLVGDLDLDGQPELYLLSSGDRFGNQDGGGGVRIDLALETLEVR